MRLVRQHLTYANVMVTILAFVVLGGTAMAATYVVSSNSQVGPGTISGHKPPSGKHANVIAGSINGTDIADQSGVDTCRTPLTKEFGPICVGTDGGARKWEDAAQYCAGFGLRLPTLSEAIALAKNYDVPGVSTSQEFWTDDTSWDTNNNTDSLLVAAVTEDGDGMTYVGFNAGIQTVCVTDPSA